MNKTEIIDYVFMHVGRTDDLENLIELAEEIAKMAALEERDACKSICEEQANGGLVDGYDSGVSACVRSIENRYNNK